MGDVDVVSHEMKVRNFKLLSCHELDRHCLHKDQNMKQTSTKGVLGHRIWIFLLQSMHGRLTDFVS